MSDTNATMALWKKRLIADLKRDKKRTSILAVLTVVCLFMLSRLLIKQGADVPTTASAAITAAPAAPAPAPTSETPADRQPKLASRGEVQISRDIFRPDPNFYPVSQKVAVIVAASQPQPDPEQVRLEQEAQRRKAIEKAAHALNLTGTIVGDRSVAMIGGQVLATGQTVEGFVIEDITPLGCVLQKDGVRVAIEKKE